MINNLIYRVTNNFDTLTASHHLRRLRDSGLLVQQGKGSATYYILNSQFLSTEKSEVDNFNLDSSTVKEETLSGQSSTPNLDSSTVKEETLSGQSSTPNLGSSRFHVKSRYDGNLYWVNPQFFLSTLLESVNAPLSLLHWVRLEVLLEVDFDALVEDFWKWFDD